jgi:hypothetical protein
MGGVFGLLALLFSIGSLVCFILVLVKMFQNDQVGLGIACIVLIFVCGIGGLVAFIYGWVKAAEWNIQNIMLAWTGCVIGGVVVNVLAIATGQPVFWQMGG